MHRFAFVLTLFLCWPPHFAGSASAQGSAADPPPTAADAVRETEPGAVIRSFHDTLLETMRQADALGFSGRFDRLAPAIAATFDIATMTRYAVGPEWRRLTVEQHARLVEAFREYTVANYAARFDDFSGERLEVLETREGPRGERIVRTRIVPETDEPVAINYLMRRIGDGSWRVVDVFLEGTISELATRRSEFASVMRQSGVEGLLTLLRRKTDALRTS